MAWLRRHLAAIVAGATVLACGIALGAGPFQNAEGADDDAVSSAPSQQLRDQLQALRQGQVFEDSVTEAYSPALLKGRLTGSAVGLFVLPGVSRSTVDGMQSALARAGSSLSYTAYLHSDLTDAAHRTYVETVAASSLRSLKDLPTGPRADPYEQISALVARAYVAPADALPLDREAVNIDSELRGAKLVTISSELQRRASLVVVLAPADHGSDPAVTAAHSIEVDLIAACSAAGDAVLVAAPPQASAPGGLLDALATSAPRLPLSTLNVVEGPGAELAVVYALAGAERGDTGAFGVDGTDVALPPGLSSAGR